MFHQIMSVDARDLKPEPDDAQTPFKGVKSRELARETEARTAAEIEAWGDMPKCQTDLAMPRSL